MSISRGAQRKIRHRRVRKRVAGTATRPRLAVFRSNRYIYAQVIDDVSGVTLATASSLEKDLRGSRLTVETATKVGHLVAERARNAGVGQVVFDRGGYPFHGRVKALAEAARTTGLEF
ncbi:MAG: 50S ribosomal protein L18 [Acidimicrobiia bacterium]|nr:50S ribosomal protein L18 [Acidimicrobiia bacterium]